MVELNPDLPSARKVLVVLPLMDASGFSEMGSSPKHEGSKSRTLISAADQMDETILRHKEWTLMLEQGLSQRLIFV